MNTNLASSVQSRFIATIIANTLRSGLSFITGLLIARGLGPEQYGNFVFLLGSFVALRQLLDMSTSSAFYTFISRRPRPLPFLLSYFGWQGLQFVLPVMAIGLLMPQIWVDQIWLGQNRGIILLSFVAVFLQQQAWQTLIQIGESSRLTHQVQGMNAGIAAIHLVLVVIFWKLGSLSVYLLFSLIIAEYLLALSVSYFFIWRNRARNIITEKSPFIFRTMLDEFGIFCAPLVVYSWVGFAYEFADRWMLQRFGGATEQGFYAIGYQFASISLLATTSILQIFWKEIAEAHERKNIKRVKMLYHKVSRSLFMLSAMISGFLIPWSKEIIGMALGPAYITAASALAIMLLYPVHQSMGQILGVMYYATGKTKPYAVIGLVFMLISIPVAYFALAPTDAWLPGLALGSMGMAVKMVVLQLISVNISAWLISRIYSWKFDWMYQVIGLGGVVLLGWTAYEGIALITSGLQLHLFLKGGFTFLLYSFLTVGMIWAMPWLVGMEREEIRTIMNKLKTYI